MLDSTKLFAQIVQSIHSGLMVVGIDKKIIYANEPAQAIFHATGLGLIGKSCEKIFPDTLAQSLLDSLEKIQKTKEPIRVDKVKLILNRRRIFIGYTAYPLSEKTNGPVQGMIVSGRDITKLIQLETRYQKAEKLATASQMLLTFHHEIRNPLTGILSSFRVLKSKSITPAMQKKLLKIIEDSAEKLEKVVDQFAKLDTLTLEDYPGGQKIFKLPEP